MKKNINSQIADLYAYAGIKEEYSEGVVQRYGQEVVDAAIKLVPQIREYEEGVAILVDHLRKNPLSDLYASMLSRSALYGGSHDSSSDIFDVLASISNKVATKRYKRKA